MQDIDNMLDSNQFLTGYTNLCCITIYDQARSRGMVSDAWIAFARTGSANTPKLPYWTVFTAKDRAGSDPITLHGINTKNIVLNLARINYP